MTAENPYGEESTETPLERGARAEAARESRRGGNEDAEREADAVVGDVDDYVAITDPDALAEAEAALDAWEVPTSPLEGVPGNVALNPGYDGRPLVSVFSARTESEANIVRGVLESQGIAAILREVATPAYGSIFSVSEARWADLLVSGSQVDAARIAIKEALESGRADSEISVPEQNKRVPETG